MLNAWDEEELTDDNVIQDNPNNDPVSSGGKETDTKEEKKRSFLVTSSVVIGLLLVLLVVLVVVANMFAKGGPRIEKKEEPQKQVQQVDTAGEDRQPDQVEASPEEQGGTEDGSKDESPESGGGTEGGSLEKVKEPESTEPKTSNALITNKEVFVYNKDTYEYLVTLSMPTQSGTPRDIDYFVSKKVYTQLNIGDTVEVTFEVGKNNIISVVSISK